MVVISSPTQGLTAASDSNFDATVDGADLANLLAAWGPAPRCPMPPSDCPLVLILLQRQEFSVPHRCEVTNPPSLAILLALAALKTG